MAQQREIPGNIIEEAILMNNPGAQYVMKSYGESAPATPENVATAAQIHKLPFLYDLDQFCISPYCKSISTLTAPELLSYTGQRNAYLSRFGGKLKERIAERREAKATPQEAQELYNDSVQYAAMPQPKRAKVILGGLAKGLLSGASSAMDYVQSGKQPQTIQVEPTTAAPAATAAPDNNKKMLMYGGIALGVVALLVLVTMLKKRK